MIEVSSPTSTKTCVIYPFINNDVLALSPESRLEEAKGLALAINLDVVYCEAIKIKEIKLSNFNISINTRENVKKKKIILVNVEWCIYFGNF